MAARASTLRLIPGGSDAAPLRRAPRVVAEILEDGTLRTGADISEGLTEHSTWVTKTVSGPDWVIWLQRRQWGPEDRSRH